MNQRQHKKKATIYFQHSISGEYYTVIYKGRYLTFHVNDYFAKGLPHRFKEQMALSSFNSGMAKIGQATRLHFSHRGQIVNH